MELSVSDVEGEAPPGWWCFRPWVLRRRPLGFSRRVQTECKERGNSGGGGAMSEVGKAFHASSGRGNGADSG
jgi:hypothetical protein